jgi:Inner membrane component domain
VGGGRRVAAEAGCGGFTSAVCRLRASERARASYRRRTLRLIGNILWLILGGLEMAVAYVVAGLFSIILIVTIPLVVPAFRMASFSLWPFGRAMVS